MSKAPVMNEIEFRTEKSDKIINIRQPGSNNAEKEKISVTVKEIPHSLATQCPRSDMGYRIHNKKGKSEIRNKFKFTKSKTCS